MFKDSSQANLNSAALFVLLLLSALSAIPSNSINEKPACAKWRIINLSHRKVTASLLSLLQWYSTYCGSPLQCLLLRCSCQLKSSLSALSSIWSTMAFIKPLLKLPISQLMQRSRRGGKLWIMPNSSDKSPGTLLF
uniref:Secreted protein n=1 Tax=Ditylenchus dipsaci TaxID=166011 RepID=A0A915CZF2_9BILA